VTHNCSENNDIEVDLDIKIARQVSWR